jgi:hypothetical protein
MDHLSSARTKEEFAFSTLQFIIEHTGGINGGFYYNENEHKDEWVLLAAVPNPQAFCENFHLSNLILQGSLQVSFTSSQNFVLANFF